MVEFYDLVYFITKLSLVILQEFFISMSETIKYNDDDHKTVFLKTLNEQRLEGEFCDILQKAFQETRSR